MARVDRVRKQRGIDHDVECAANGVDKRPPEGLAGDRVSALRRFDDLAGDECVGFRWRTVQ